MKERIKTLLIDSNGAGWKYVMADTVLRGAMRMTADVSILPGRLYQLRLMRKLLGQRYEHLSYVFDWREAICDAPELDVEACNINNLLEYRQRREAITQYPLVIILHSAAGDSMSLLLRTAHWFHGRRGKLVVFLGNEFDLMGEKCAFLQATGAEYVCSQLPTDAARWLYAECLQTQVLSMPHALNPRVYHPDASVQRTADIGFCGDLYYSYVGDRERTALIEFFRQHGAGYSLVTKFRLNERLPRPEWAHFLNGCKGIIGAESGSYYLDRRGQIIAQAKTYLRWHPGATFEEIFERFFRCPHVPYVSGKSISSRHFEPIGTKTCQILLEGHYNGILRPDEHYIRVKKDFSNIDEAIHRFKDEGYRAAMVERTYAYVMSEHTYRHRMQTLLKAVVRESPIPDALLHTA